LPVICSRIVLIEDNRYIIEKTKKEEKSQLKAQADVEMGEIPTSATALSDIVDKKIASALKKLSVKVSSDFADTVAQYTKLNSAGKRVRSDSHPQGRTKRRRQSQEGDDGRSSSETEGETVLRQVEHAEDWTLEEARQGERKVAKIVATTFRYEDPSSYPDELLTIPRPLAIRLLLRSVPVRVLETARFRSGVHLGPGTTVPDFICIHLSAGARYLPKVAPHKNKIYHAFDDFCDRLRWRIYWLTKELHDELDSKPYDPDYEIPHVRNACDLKIEYIEKGLEHGRAYIDSFVENVVPTLQRQHRDKPDLVDVKNVLSFLREHDYLVLPTDKNLGQCVVTRQWFMAETTKLVNDPNSYEKIELAKVKEILDSQRIKMNNIADNALLFFEHKQLSAFLRQHVPPEDELKYNVPRFYGIPKIHKNPVRMRPIVPCHQAMQNPAAKYVSKMLKPVIEQLPYVIKGTKHMATKLANLELIPRRKFFLVGFDLVAFYTNIDAKFCIESCKQYYKEICAPSLSEQAVMLQALNVAFKNLVFEFNGGYYLQKEGIAMGVACSPDGANIFAAVHEEVALEKERLQPSGSRIPFYGRYIDDGFMIVYAETADDALAYAKSKITIRNLELTWEVSERALPFLDLLIYIDPVTMTLQWKPFRKARNNLERIPFASHHPADVKRGTFLGEMSRMAVLSSSPANYLDALADLSKIYMARGYPYPLVKKWLKENSSKRWAERFSVRRPSSVGDGDPDSSKLLVLKTTFDPVWEAFDLHGFSDTIVKTWIHGIVAHRGMWTRFWNSGVTSAPEGGESADDYLETEATANSWLPSTVNSDPSPVLVSTAAQDAGSLALGAPMARDDSLWLKFLGKSARSNSFAVVEALDVSKVGFTDARWLVSRKRTRGLGDQLNKLKREALDADSQLKNLWELCGVHLPLETESGDDVIATESFDMEL
jgi:hypothetical protein